jgi:hypothetical protein
MEHAWKVCKQKCFQGSNPCLTAINKKPDYKSGFLFIVLMSGENPAVRKERSSAHGQMPPRRGYEFGLAKFRITSAQDSQRLPAGREN